MCFVVRTRHSGSLLCVHESIESRKSSARRISVGQLCVATCYCRRFSLAIHRHDNAINAAILAFDGVIDLSYYRRLYSVHNSLAL